MPSPVPEFGEPFPAANPAELTPVKLPDGWPRSAPPTARVAHRWWLHGLLLFLTLLSTTFMGARLAANFASNVPSFQDDGLSALGRMAQHPLELINGLPFSLTLLVILMAHEMGHYIACQYYGIDASLPYFLPAPTWLGTFGAFIRIRSPIFSKKALFDVGVAGPLAGFLFLVPALAIGVAYGKILPAIATRGDVSFGVPLIEWLLRGAIFPGTPDVDIYLHPIGRAAWMGALATAINLLPIGQLDGGHLLFALFGERCRPLWKIAIAILVAMGYFSLTWLFWAIFLTIFALKHPPLFDHEPLGSGRVQLAVASLVVLIICFTPVPIQ